MHPRSRRRLGAAALALVVTAQLAVAGGASAADGSWTRDLELRQGSTSEIRAESPSALASAATVTDRGDLRHWDAAYRSTTTRRAVVAVVGASNSEGAGVASALGERYGDRLQRGLRAARPTRGCLVTADRYHGSGSFIPAWYQFPTLPSPDLIGSAKQHSTVGMSGRAVELRGGDGVRWAFSGTQVTLHYDAHVWGRALVVYLDGRRVATLSTRSSAAGFTPRRWTSGVVANARHTITVRASAAGAQPASAYVSGIKATRGDAGRCVHVEDLSHSGFSAADLVRRPGVVTDGLALRPDLVVLQLGFNDAGQGRTPKDFAGDLRTVMGRLDRAGYQGDYLLLGVFAPDAHWSRPWWEYRAAMRAVALSRPRTAYADVSAAFPPVAQSAGTGLYSDLVHLSARGHARMADLLLPVLLPR